MNLPTHLAAASIGLAILGSGAARAEHPAPPTISTLLITGHNNHNWPYTSRVHKETLEATGRFAVTITDDLPADLERWNAAGSAPRFDLFVLDYNDVHAPRRWGGRADKWFIQSVLDGAGVAAIHSADNAFKGWEDYEAMLGLLWREGAGHGDFHEFTVNLTDTSHPITAGLADFTTTDELYHNLSNPRGAKFNLLAQAFDKKEIRGTGRDEPMAITLSFGKGRVFATPLGHVWTNLGDARPGMQAQKASVLNPGFRALLCRGAEWAATGSVTLPPAWTDTRDPNPPLTAEEKAAGWRSLFDGKTTAHWKAFRKPGFPDKGWSVTDGLLIHAAQGGGGDICTTDQFGDFEFVCEWRVAPGGNSGIMYRCTEDRNYPWETGREMQVLDDQRHADGQKGPTRAGTMYALYPCAYDVSRPAGEWNHARIVCKGSRIEHWLNGFRVVAVDTSSDEYLAAIAASKFKTMPDFGKPMRGHIALQDHGDEVAYRNIRVRSLEGH